MIFWQEKIPHKKKYLVLQAEIVRSEALNPHEVIALLSQSIYRVLGNTPGRRQYAGEINHMFCGVWFKFHA